MQETNPDHELMELRHDPWPGFLTVFYVVMGLASIYLLIVFLSDPDGALRNPHHGHGEAGSHAPAAETSTHDEPPHDHD